MRKQGNVLVIEVKDLNVVLAMALRDYQFTNHNEIPEKIVVEQLVSATGRNRSNDANYDVSIDYVYGADYYCGKCEANHKLGSNRHQEHQEHRVVDA